MSDVGGSEVCRAHHTFWGRQVLLLVATPSPHLARRQRRAGHVPRVRRATPSCCHIPRPSPPAPEARRRPQGGRSHRGRSAIWSETRRRRERARLVVVPCPLPKPPGGRGGTRPGRSGPRSPPTG